jgi:hypothetical protein
MEAFQFDFQCASGTSGLYGRLNAVTNPLVIHLYAVFYLCGQIPMGLGAHSNPELHLMIAVG